MPEFDIQLLVQGKLLTRRVQAEHVAGAHVQCAAGEIIVSTRRLRRYRPKRRTPPFSLHLFLEELSALLGAGLVLIEALETLQQKSTGERHMQPVLARLTAEMRCGVSFSQALAALPEIFPPLLIATVAASEDSGQMPAALQRFQHYEVRLQNIRKRVTGALMYPGIVMAVGFGVLLFMLFFVVPRFATVFQAVNHPPLTAQAMLWWSDFVQRHGMMLGAGLGVAAIGACCAVRTQAMRKALLHGMWRVPKLKDFCHLFTLARFYRSAGLLMGGGVPVIDALSLSGRMLPPAYGARLDLALEQVSAGQAVSAILPQHGLSTPVAERLLRVGEQSGNLGGMCEHIAHFHDNALDRSIEIFSKIFEPLLMLLVGAIVGVVVVLLYMPIFELAGSIS